MRAAIAGAVALVTITLLSPTARADDGIAGKLAKVRDTGTMSITTRGRKTGKPHTVPVWFVVDGDAILLGTLNVKRDWVRNAAKTPAVEIAIDDVKLRGELWSITDPAASQRFHDLLAKKYWVAWAGSFLSKGPEQAFRIDRLSPIP